MRRPIGDSLPFKPIAGSASARIGHPRAHLLLVVSLTLAATFAPHASVHAQLTEPSYWRTRVFFIPYQSSTPVGFAHTVDKVQLLVARGGDTQWAVLQEAEPQVRGFSYHAPVDGEYAFAVRTINRKGEASPATIAQPQLRVVVDTVPPTMQLTAAADASGRMILRYDASDLQLKPETVRLEASTDGATWQRIATGPPDVSQPDRVAGQVAWKPPTATGAVKFRATVDDRAGNQFSANADASLVGAFAPTPQYGGVAQSPTPPQLGLALNAPAQSNPFVSQPTSEPGRPAPGASSTPQGAQEWTAAAPALSAPNNAPDSKSVFLNNAPQAPQNNNPFAAAQPTGANSPPPPPLWPEDRTPARLVADNGGAPSNNGSNPTANSPFAAPPLVGGSPNGFNNGPFQSASAPMNPPAPFGSQFGNQTPPGPPSWSAVPTEQPADATGTRWVNSLTFDVDYDLQTVGPWGVSKVELFGTRDGGATWTNFGSDPDNRSPMRVTVPAAGTYGFRLVVNGANGSQAPTPTAGQQPELVIGVDLAEPQAQLNAAEIGQGNLADHLIIRWTAADENLDSRPVGLFFASSSDGPWSTVATDLDNNGQYAWRLLQQVPERLFLRLEVRDKAGNVAIHQSPAPVALNLPQPTGKLRSVRPVQSEPQRFRTATGQAIRNQ
ncbi:hypothetical protein [Lacipirellula parvula]|uniref:Uncharacterized protein n=1 Tax=Lacipirellula parvula TaxID=2650471 RepID=A0A5K7XKR8_9BACT|nr:hypothetical protein [Lacipirellula parvula]BBO34933.1 hypothetical protein PLANPX_4545 [Lacipirellula parvula]